MNRTVRLLAWLFFAAILYLIFAETLTPWLHLPGLGNIGFTAVFFLFALSHCLAVEGPRRTLQFFAVSAVVSYLMEEIGVRTGLIFGAYHYGNGLGTKLGHVPILIPLAWFMMIYPSRAVAKAMLNGIDLRSIRGITALSATAAFVMTAWDVVMDPGMALGGSWIWEKGGAYFGVPRHNYLGWLLTTFLVYWITGWLWRRQQTIAITTKLFTALPVIVYGVYALRYVAANHFPELQLIALFSMGLPALVASIQLCCNPKQQPNYG